MGSGWRKKWRSGASQRAAVRTPPSPAGHTGKWLQIFVITHWTLHIKSVSVWKRHRGSSSAWTLKQANKPGASRSSDVTHVSFLLCFGLFFFPKKPALGGKRLWALSPPSVENRNCLSYVKISVVLNWYFIFIIKKKCHIILWCSQATALTPTGINKALV